MEGRIHSFETMGCADGPGVRFIAFLQGCPLRCCYCHNPDTWDPQGGQRISAEDIIEKANRYRPYFGQNGGLTLSGGEPMMQPLFVAEILRRAKECGIHTALDTSAMAGEPYWEEILAATDLVIADLKFADEQAYRKNSGGSLAQVLRFLKKTEEMKIPLWIRHVVAPGLTDRDVPAIRRLAEQFSNLEKLELLPFRKLCLSKYEQLGIPFPMKNTPECSEDMIKALYQK